MKIILASASPRRKELLSNIIDNFEVIPSNFDEDTVKQIENAPDKLVETLSKFKGEEVYSRIKLEEDFIIISSDTMVFFNNELLGKPKDNDEAFNMLKKLQNNAHTVYTGMFVLIKKGNKITKNLTNSQATVKFNELSNKEILDYIDKEECLQRAGAYSIQAMPKEFVKEIDGDINTVIGLDIKKLEKIVKSIVKVKKI